jgi:hypothetical protein
VPDPIELSIDVTDAVGLGVELRAAATVHLPDGPLCDPPVVAFMYPGGGYGRRYYSFDMPDSTGGGQAGFHNARGWIVVTCDHLGVGDSTVIDPDPLGFETIALGNFAVIREVMRQLEHGELGLPPVRNAVKLGFGQSMGGAFLIVLQGQHAPFDGIATLGASAIHTVVPARPGTTGATWPWYARGANLATATPLNLAALMAAAGPAIMDSESLGVAAQADEHPFRWPFHYDDEPADVVDTDLYGGVDPAIPLPEWKSRTIPSCSIYLVAPGAVALEASAIVVPVLTATGERDVVPDPWMEPKAFMSSTDVTVFVCPQMAHMHNFATTRTRFWQRLHSWGTSVAAGLT